MPRSNSYNADDLIENPSGIIESIIRDEILTERDLIIDSVSIADIEFSTLTPLNSAVDNFYGGAGIGNSVLVNVTRNQRYEVTTYTGATKILHLISTPSGWSAGDHCYLKNVNANIDTASFDTFSTNRSSWKFARSLTYQQDSRSILEQLCFEAHCILVKSYNKYKIIGLGSGETVGTFSQPMSENGRPKVLAQMTLLSQIFTDYTLNYGYDYAKKIYTKKIFVNKNTASDAYLNGLKTLCRSAEVNYKIKNKWEYNSDWIQDDNTALYFLESIVNWFYQQRIIVSWYGSPKTHIQYEIGDRVLIDYDFMIPTGKNNSANFLIVGKSMDISKKKVRFTLI